MARLYVICGNCGSDTGFGCNIDMEGRDIDGENFEPEVYIKCNNCSTLHALSDKAEIKGGE